MNIIIVGLGKIGQKLAEGLGEEHENITVIDKRASAVGDIVDACDVMGVVGSGASIETLEEAGIKEADILIAVTDSDETNLLTCLVAKKLSNCRTIARVRKPEYSREMRLLKDDLGLAMVINPELATAEEIARVLRFPSAIQIDTFAKGRVEILKFKIPEDSVLHHMPVYDISMKLGCDILVCGVERENEVYIPDGSFVLQSGDLVSIVAAPKMGSAFFKKIGIKTGRVKDTVIVGGGTTSYYLAKRLSQTGIKIKIIEKDEKRCEELNRHFPKATIINGDGTENRMLMEEGIENAESFVALTNIDEENIMLSLFAKSKMNGGKQVAKIDRIAFDEVIGSLGLDTVIYPKNIVADYIVKFVRAAKNSMGSNVETMHRILDGKAEALEFRVNESAVFVGQRIRDINFKSNMIIACINRGSQVIIPHGNDTIEVGDSVVVVTTDTGAKDIMDILE